MLDLARWKRVGNDGVDGVRRAECMSDMVEECCLEGSKRRVNSGQKECESTMGGGKSAAGDSPTSRRPTHPRYAIRYRPSACGRTIFAGQVRVRPRLHAGRGHSTSGA